MPRESVDSGGEFESWELGSAERLAEAQGTFRRAARIPGFVAAWREAGFEPRAGAESDWSAIPFLSKEALIEAARVKPPFGDRLGVPAEDLAHVFVAPGPIYMPYTDEDLGHVAASFAKAFRSCGLTASDLVDQTTMYNWVIAATVIDKALGMVGCATIPGGVGQSDRHLEVIRALGVTGIVSFPTFLEHLLETASAAGLSLPLKTAVVMGELSHPNAKARMRAEYGLSVREFYGVADVGAVAWECEACDGMHLRDDLLIEFVEPSGTRPATPSAGAPAEIVVTDWRRQAMPILRLRTGDLIDELQTSRCRCGRCSPRIGRIVGRSSEITKVKGMFVVPRLVGDVLARRDITSPFRLVVTRPEGGQDELTVEIERESLDELDGLKSQVEQALRLRVDLKLVPALPQGGPRLVDTRLAGSAAAVQH